MIDNTFSATITWNNEPKQARLSVDGVSSCLCTFYNNGKANIMIIDSVFTKEEFRGQGYSVKLMEAALALAKKEKIDCAELIVNEENIAARSLYEKIGFKKTKKNHYRIIFNIWEI
ncbi:GNAT family N-acetyltransferase [Patescibacteria group bacterium]